METFMLIISEPFTWGLVVGLFLLVMVWRLMRQGHQHAAQRKEAFAGGKQRASGAS